jgi:hypothetical protein
MIIEHRDYCDPRAWAAMALGGAVGFFAGRSHLLRSFKAKKMLQAFIAKIPRGCSQVGIMIGIDLGDVWISLGGFFIMMAAIPTLERLPRTVTPSQCFRRVCSGQKYLHSLTHESAPGRDET